MDVRTSLNVVTEEDEVLLADGFEGAFVGVGSQFNTLVAVYDLDKMMSILMERDGMSYDDAEEYISFNVTGAWVGPKTPIFLRRAPLEEVLQEIEDHPR